MYDIGKLVILPLVTPSITITWLGLQYSEALNMIVKIKVPEHTSY